MNSKIIVLAMALIAVSVGQAQPATQPLESDSGLAEVLPAVQAPKTKKVVRYDQATNQVVETEEPVVLAPSGTSAAGASSPIYILNNQKYQGYQGSTQGTAQKSTQTAIQEQPTTVIEAAPLKESRAEVLRKSRQDLETKTEQKIVEKLEEARIEDETSRSERLFGDRFGSGKVVAPFAGAGASQTTIVEQTPVQIVAPVAVAPVQPAAPAVVRAPEVAPDEPKPDMKAEIRAALEEANASKKPVDLNQYYIGASVGMADYPEVRNVKGNGTTGIAIGLVTEDRIIVEGNFMYSNYELKVVDSTIATQYPLFKDLSQYNVGAGLKYQILPGRFRPYVGALADYTYRRYSDKQSNSVKVADVTSYAFDLGFSAGADLLLTKTFALGADFRYFTNVANRQDNDYQNSFINNAVRTKPLEELDYYAFTMSAKLFF